jgi:hypothetical protein
MKDYGFFYFSVFSAVMELNALWLVCGKSEKAKKKRRTAEYIKVGIYENLVWISVYVVYAFLLSFNEVVSNVLVYVVLLSLVVFISLRYSLEKRTRKIRTIFVQQNSRQPTEEEVLIF